MSKKTKKAPKTLLEGKTIRRFMELANLPKKQINEYVEKQEEGARLEPELDTVEEEQIGERRALYEMPDDEDPLDDEEVPMDDAPVDDVPMGDEPPMPDEEPMPDMGGGEEEVVKNMVDAIADAIEQSTGVEINVTGDELGGDPGAEDPMGDEMPPADAAPPMGDEAPMPDEEEPFPEDELDEAKVDEETELEETAKEPWKGGSGAKWKKLSEKQIVTEVAKRVIERLKGKK